jgi:DNA-binding transcriptional LysR family regulator
MNYSIDDLRALCAVVRLGRFTDAAEALHVTPSALSRRIANIECEIGGALFARTTRKVSLTPIGAQLHDKVLPLVTQLDSSMAQAAEALKGRSQSLAIAAVATIAASSLHRISKAFFAEHPNVFLAIRDGTAAAVTHFVESGEVQFGITTQLTFGSSIRAEPLGHYGFNLILAEKPQGRPRTMAWGDLAGMRFVGLNPLSSTRLQIDGALRTLGMSLPWKVEVDQLSTLVAMVRHGGYASVMPTLFDSKAHGVEGIPLSGPALTRELFLIRRADSAETAEGTSFARHAKRRIHGTRA